MTDIVIQVEHLSMLYHIGKARQRHDTVENCGMRNADCGVRG